MPRGRGWRMASKAGRTRGGKGIEGRRGEDVGLYCGAILGDRCLCCAFHSPTLGTLRVRQVELMCHQRARARRRPS